MLSGKNNHSSLFSGILCLLHKELDKVDNSKWSISNYSHSDKSWVDISSLELRTFLVIFMLKLLSKHQPCGQRIQMCNK